MFSAHDAILALFPVDREGEEATELVVGDEFSVTGDEASEVPAIDELSVLGSEATATGGLPKNLASCTSVESSSPGIGSSLVGLIFLTSLRTVLRSFWAPGEGV